MHNAIRNYTAGVLLSSILTFANEAHTQYIPIMMDSLVTIIKIYNNGPDLYEETFTNRDDMVIVHKSTNLMWVNEADVSKGKCAKVHQATFSKDFQRAKGFCKSSEFGNFAGFSNWRTPTVSELETFIKATKNMDVNYDAHCAKLLAIKDDKVSQESADESYTTITTRYSNQPLGVDAGNLKPNFGLRCVRTIEE